MVLIIAEAGVNHNGSLDLAKELVDAAKTSGADVIKFQSFKADRLVIPGSQKANYQINKKSDETQLEMLRKLELNQDEQKELKNYCDQKDIEFLSSGFDLESLSFLEQLNLKRYKIPSGEITNLPYLRMIGSKNKPTILSTGMSNMKEIELALEHLIISGTKKENITILHCTTEYPAPFKDVNLRAMNTIKKKFNTNIGYSDHTLGIEISLAAVALGASVIEKHLTLDRDMQGPDHKASLEPKEFETLVRSSRNINISLGKKEKEISDSEIKNLNIVRKSIVARKDINKGELFSEDNLSTKRPGYGISPMKWDEIIGKISGKNYKKNDLIMFD